MALCRSWRLKRYGRSLPDSGGKGPMSWKLFEADEKRPAIALKVVEPGYLLVMQGQECLDTISLLDSFGSFKVQQNSHNLFFRSILKGESRMLRMQFDGSSQAEAIKECSSAVKKLMEYVPITTQESTLLQPDQPPAEDPPPTAQKAGQEKAVGGKQEDVQGMLTVKQLAQHYLGETTLTLPREYSHSSLAQCDLVPILHLFLLDPGFFAFVEKVESELKKLLDE